MSTIGFIPSPIFMVIPILIKSLIDLGISYREAVSNRTKDGKIQHIDLLIQDENGRNIGFEKTKDGKYRIMADCSGLNKNQLKKQKDLLKKIMQRYTYNNVINELKKQGYVISEEEKVQNNTIRLVARKWS